MLGFGVSIFVITFIYNLLLSQMILSIGNSTLQVLAEALKDAVSSCFILYAVYFLFLDLFSNHREEKQEVEAERIDPKRKNGRKCGNKEIVIFSSILLSIMIPCLTNKGELICLV